MYILLYRSLFISKIRERDLEKEEKDVCSYFDDFTITTTDVNLNYCMVCCLACCNSEAAGAKRMWGEELTFDNGPS